MPFPRQRETILAVLGLVALGAGVTWFGILRPDPPAQPFASIAEADRQPAPAGAPANAGGGAAVASSEATPAKPEQMPEPKDAPSFDVIRVEPNGDSVIAGRGVPGATVEMLRNGELHARAASDLSGLFALVPPPLPVGSHEIVLQTIAPDGARALSRESVTIVITGKPGEKPLIALTSPDKPTVVLSAPERPAEVAAAEREASAPASSGKATAPEAPKEAPVTPATPTAGGQPKDAPQNADATKPAPAPSAPQVAVAAPPSEPKAAEAKPVEPAQPPKPAETAAAEKAQPAPKQRARVKVSAVESEDGGKLFVSGKAAPGATVRLYLNETFVAPGGADQTGRVAFAIARGVRPGDYRVRLDDVDPVSGDVRSRAEVAYRVPSSVQIELPPPAPVAITPPAAAPKLPAAASLGSPAVESAPRLQAHSETAPRGTAQAVDQAAPRGAAAQTQPVSPSPAQSVVEAAPAVSPTRSATAPATPGASPTVASVREADPGLVVIPEINTAIVSRGDNLWRISKRTYGRGIRYTVIYSANEDQIRNPHLIFPGQIFVLPGNPEVVGSKSGQ